MEAAALSGASVAHLGRAAPSTSYLRTTGSPGPSTAMLLSTLMRPDDHDQAQRRAARSKWPLRAFRAGEHPEDRFLHELSVEERLAAQNDITETCWLVAGRTIEDIPRNRWPLKVLRRDRKRAP